MERSGGILLESILNFIYNGVVAIHDNAIIKYFNKIAERMFNIPRTNKNIHCIEGALDDYGCPELCLTHHPHFALLGNYGLQMAFPQERQMTKMRC